MIFVRMSMWCVCFVSWPHNLTSNVLKLHSERWPTETRERKVVILQDAGSHRLEHGCLLSERRCHHTSRATLNLLRKKITIFWQMTDICQSLPFKSLLIYFSGLCVSRRKVIVSEETEIFVTSEDEPLIYLILVLKNYTWSLFSIFTFHGQVWDCFQILFHRLNTWCLRTEWIERMEK